MKMSCFEILLVYRSLYCGILKVPGQERSNAACVSEISHCNFDGPFSLCVMKFRATPLVSRSDASLVTCLGNVLCSFYYVLSSLFGLRSVTQQAVIYEKSRVRLSAVSVGVFYAFVSLDDPSCVCFSPGWIFRIKYMRFVRYPAIYSPYPASMLFIN